MHSTVVSKGINMINILADKLEAHSEVIAKFTGTITCLHFLSGAFLMCDIRSKGSSDAYQIDPFLGGVVQTILSLKLGLILHDDAMVHVNTIGLIVNILYTIIFYNYSSTAFKKRIISKVFVASVFCAICLLYVYFEDTGKVEFRLGMIITALLVILVGMPLLNLREIIRRQSVDCLPFPIIMGGSVVSASWTLYAISIKNSLLMYQNLFLLMLSCIQISLFIVYPNKNKQPKHQSNESKQLNVKSEASRQKLN